MNSGYARKSTQELKEQARQQMQTAARAEPCIAVTEPNWKAMIGLQKTQTELLSEILESQAQLTTRSELTRILSQQNDTLMKFTEDAETLTMEYQEQMEQQASAFTEQMNTEMQNMSSQAGKMSEQFLKSLSTAEDKMKKCLTKAFWISLMPTAILIIWELIRHIWLPS